jgi:hypothetical protein
MQAFLAGSPAPVEPASECTQVDKFRVFSQDANSGNYQGIPLHYEKLGAFSTYYRYSILSPEPVAPTGTVVTLHNGKTLSDTQLGPEEFSYSFRPSRISQAEYNSMALKPIPPDVTREYVRVPHIVVHLTSVHVRRWELASKALFKHWKLFSSECLEGEKVVDWRDSDCLKYRISNWPDARQHHYEGNGRGQVG